jgi:hypothetical protein
MGMITPLGQGRRDRVWFHAALIYTSGGVVSSCAVGVFVGWLGQPIRNYVSEITLWRAFVGLAVIFALRDMKLITFALPQRHCQAPHWWLHEFDFNSALFMWGFHIGAGFATFIYYSGLYALLCAVLISGSPMFGGTLMLCYWLGRALSVWIAPILTRSWPIATVRQRGLEDPTLFRGMSIFSLFWSAAVGLVGILSP